MRLNEWRRHKLEFLAVHETCKAVFGLTPGCEEKALRAVEFQLRGP